MKRTTSPNVGVVTLGFMVGVMFLISVTFAKGRALFGVLCEYVSVTSSRNDPAVASPQVGALPLLGLEVLGGGRDDNDLISDWD